jgi:hypothetical protein
VGQAAPADRTDLVDPAERDQVDRRPADPVGARRVVRAELMGPADRARLVPRLDPRPADRHLVGPRPVDPRPVDRSLVDTDLVVRADPHLAGLVVRVGLNPMVTVRAVRAVRAVPVGLVRVGLVAPVDPVDMDLAVPVRLGPAARVGPVDLVDLVGRADLTGLADPVDHRRRPMCSTVPSTAVARSSAVRGTRRTASARPTTVLRHRPRNVGLAGTTGLLRGIRRRTGMGRPLPVVGTVRRLPVVGTRHGTVPAAT